MPGSSDPSLWQAFLDSRLVQALAFGLSVAIAFGVAVGRFLKRAIPETREDAEIKSRIEGGLIKQIAHDLHELAETQKDLGKGQQDLRERVVRIETILEGRNGK